MPPYCHIIINHYFLWYHLCLSHDKDGTLYMAVILVAVTNKIKKVLESNCLSDNQLAAVFVKTGLCLL